MKGFLISLLFSLLFCEVCSAQLFQQLPISYSYDSAGNRIARNSSFLLAASPETRDCSFIAAQQQMKKVDIPLLSSAFLLNVPATGKELSLNNDNDYHVFDNWMICPYGGRLALDKDLYDDRNKKGYYHDTTL